MMRTSKPLKRDPDLCWTTVAIPRDHVMKAWKVGPLMGIETHYHFGAKKTQPCLKWITRGELTCEGCLARVKRRYSGYLPLLIDKSFEKVVVVISSTLHLQVDAYALKTPLHLKLPPGKRPAIIKSVSHGEMDITSARLMKQAKEYDITRYLLCLWNCHELTNWFGEKGTIDISGLIDDNVPTLGNPQGEQEIPL